MAKTNNQQGYKTSIQHQNRKKYETIVEEIRLQLTQVQALKYLLQGRLTKCPMTFSLGRTYA